MPYHHVRVRLIPKECRLMRGNNLVLASHDLIYGLTDGKKWFAYAYRSMQQAEKVLIKGEFNDPQSEMVRYVNISYPAPFILAEEK